MNARFGPGDAVRVKASFPPGHVRTPHFTRGHRGRVVTVLGHFPNPERLAYGQSGKPAKALYRIAFSQHDLWDAYAGAAGDELIADIYDHWLEAAHD